MTRFARPAFTLGALVSLLLCAAVAVIWARSGSFEALDFRYNRAPRDDEHLAYHFRAASYAGMFSLTVNRRRFSSVYFRGLTDEELRRFHQAYPKGMRWIALHRAKLSFASPPWRGWRARHSVTTRWPDPRWTGMREDDFVLVFRPWLPIALLLVLPALWLHRFRKVRRRVRLGLCPACGYDLRASADRCPECGRAAPASLASPAARAPPAPPANAVHA